MRDTIDPAIAAIKQALANEALDKMAENARELGLDYEPAPVLYQLPDDLYDSKDWKVGSYAERVEWLHTMYEAKKRELEYCLDAAPVQELVCVCGAVWQGQELVETPAAQDLQTELEATNRQVEILSDALAESRREVAALTAVQEPAAIVSGYYGGQCVILPTEPARLFNSGTAFYTTPPADQRQWVHATPWRGLTDEEILDKCEVVPDFDIGNHDLIEFARAIEAKLKEKNSD